MNESSQQQDENNLIPVSSTLCHNCIFADYDNNIQTGCKADRLNKFKKANITISEMVYEDTTSYVIEEKVCVYYRNKSWASEHYKNIDNENLVETINKELRIPYHALLFLRQNDNIDDLSIRLAELEQQKIKPKMVTVIDRTHTPEPMTNQLLTIVSKYSFDYWRVQTIQAIDQIDTDVIDLVYDSTKKIPYMFYICFECQHTIPPTVSNDIHTSLHDDMKAFTVLMPNDNNVGKAVLKVAHEKHAGNSFTIPLEDKIRHYDDAPHLIKKVEEICPSLQTF